jgi:plasmid stability protein
VEHGTCATLSQVTNLTLTVDEDVLRRARIRALERGTSVNAVLREFLAAYAGAADEQQRAVTSLLEIARRSVAGRGESRWTRDDLHDRESARG